MYHCPRPARARGLVIRNQSENGIRKVASRTARARGLKHLNPARFRLRAKSRPAGARGLNPIGSPLGPGSRAASRPGGRVD